MKDNFKFRLDDRTLADGNEFDDLVYTANKADGKYIITWFDIEDNCDYNAYCDEISVAEYIDEGYWIIVEDEEMEGV